MNYKDILIDGKAPSWWNWKNFTPKEVSCKHCGEIWKGGMVQSWNKETKTVEQKPPKWFVEAMDTLQLFRDQWNKPIILNSAHRCQEHNKAVGGVSNSQHYTHIAFDCRCPREDQMKMSWVAQNAGFKFVKLYPDRGFIHIDMRFGK